MTPAPERRHPVVSRRAEATTKATPAAVSRVASKTAVEATNASAYRVMEVQSPRPTEYVPGGGLLDASRTSSGPGYPVHRW